MLRRSSRLKREDGTDGSQSSQESTEGGSNSPYPPPVARTVLDIEDDDVESLVEHIVHSPPKSNARKPSPTKKTVVVAEKSPTKTEKKKKDEKANDAAAELKQMRAILGNVDDELLLKFLENANYNLHLAINQFMDSPSMALVGGAGEEAELEEAELEEEEGKGFESAMARMFVDDVFAVMFNNSSTFNKCSTCEVLHRVPPSST